jgi:hypothetical protein
MRTTIDFDVNTLRRAKARAAMEGRTLSQLVDSIVTSALMDEKKRERFVFPVLPSAGGLVEGLDPNDPQVFSKLMHEEDIEAFRRQSAGLRSPAGNESARTGP